MRGYTYQAAGSKAIARARAIELAHLPEEDFTRF